MDTNITLPILSEQISTVLHNLSSQDESSWLKRGDASVLELFHAMAQRVPAYKDFLKKHKIKPERIVTIDHLSEVPTVDKQQYLLEYPREKLCWDGEFASKQWVISTTSGSTGKPYYFPRTSLQDAMYTLTAELYMLNNFSIDKKKTLYINGFAMGAWIGGLFTYQAIKNIMDTQKYPLSIITPGVFKDEILKSIINLGKDFDQIILGGYPPMIKDVIDEGTTAGINWKDYSLGFIFSAESFTEGFREYILSQTNVSDYFRSTLNHYGTVDLGTMAHETPLTILIRTLLLNSSANEIIFANPYVQPTLVQYLPEFFYFQQQQNQLLCSSWGGIPLLRYDLKDIGGVYTYSELISLLREQGYTIEDHINNAKLQQNVWKLPFVYVHERADFVIKLYGANIFPATIRKAIQHRKFKQFLTGKFNMSVEYNEQHSPVFYLRIELRRDAEPSVPLQQRIMEEVVLRLLEENSEYASNYKSNPQKQMPEIMLLNYEHPEYFKSGGKQRWVKK
jgi:phenylacetate-CoA ligase